MFYSLILENETGHQIDLSKTANKLQIQGEVKEGDRIIITTKNGNKTVTLEREGVTINIRYNLTTFIPIRIK